MPENELPYERAEFDRWAVIVIQGGGVYGLTMLGQLSAVIEASEIKPLAFAGTSAGAVVAALSWAGYSPIQIRQLFVDLAVDKKLPESVITPPDSVKSIVDLLGPFEDKQPAFDYARFRSLAEFLKISFKTLGKSLNHGSNERDVVDDSNRQDRGVLLIRTTMFLLLSLLAFVLWKHGDISANTLMYYYVMMFGVASLLLAFRLIARWFGSLASLGAYLSIGWRLSRDAFSQGRYCLHHDAANLYIGSLERWRSRWPGLGSEFVPVAIESLKAYRDICGLAYCRRGFFDGGAFEQFIEKCLRNSPRFKPYAEAIGSETITFGVADSLYEKDPSGPISRLVPLILTATNLTTRKLMLITSYDPKFSSVSIARAVRASAGFPVFFQPVEVSTSDGAGWYVDGGVISNFPAWVFSRELRQEMASIERYRDLTLRPWLNIGLRVVADNPGHSEDVKTPELFLGSMWQLITGKVRTELEEVLAASLPRTFRLEQLQSDTKAPENVLDVDQLTHDKIYMMFTKGEEFAEEKLRPLSFVLPSGAAEDEIKTCLQELISEVLAIFGARDNQVLKLRSNIFIPNGQELILRYHACMNGNDDLRARFSYNSGLTGRCYIGRRPYVCNLETIRQWAQSVQTKPDGVLLGMTPSEHLAIRADRTWLASFPIFDPKDFWFIEAEPIMSASAPGYLEVLSELPATFDGALFGVINLDAAFNYNELKIDGRPSSGLTDPRISSTLKCLRAASLAVGRILSKSFGEGLTDA